MYNTQFFTYTIECKWSTRRRTMYKFSSSFISMNYQTNFILHSYALLFSSSYNFNSIIFTAIRFSLKMCINRLLFVLYWINYYLLCIFNHWNSYKSAIKFHLTQNKRNHNTSRFTLTINKDLLYNYVRVYYNFLPINNTLTTLNSRTWKYFETYMYTRC